MPTTASGKRPSPGATGAPLADIDRFRDALTQLVGSTRRHLHIYSQNLPHALYGEPAIVQKLSDFARSSRYARVQILIADSEPLLRRPHPLLPLLQRLGSRIALKKIQPSTEPSDWEFALGDTTQVLQRADHDKWQGHYHSDNPVRVRQLQEVFAQAWLHARPDPELRQFVL
ncbi:hypothetical protein JF535_11725 [Microbulbifer salipaludis]|uniref:DUF7931 domain-containing protein n=1 Tax=Microbulbifer salipaludis TaxID=187980 RepID=A0ABS3E8D1_9GAMM|nr:hypothetical protein [Microbulbifer salipaludis]MBN8431522.1 hypothetical protein [Microbulbifer salipaludis]